MSGKFVPRKVKAACIGVGIGAIPAASDGISADFGAKKVRIAALRIHGERGACPERADLRRALQPVDWHGLLPEQEIAFEEPAVAGLHIDAARLSSSSASR
ncbi:MAG: hypothetical protein HUU15_14540 [Candidatus Brocadiae bacterium]|nr:hypothetical protein [Candidatus Brocadiia bacterium]